MGVASERAGRPNTFVLGHEKKDSNHSSYGGGGVSGTGMLGTTASNGCSSPLAISMSAG